MRKIRMILADDEPVILNGLKMIIDWEVLGLEIVGEASDGKELVEMLDTRDPELIVTDICMPGLTGIDVLRQIEASGRTIKVIFISAYKEFAYAQDALKYGALDYLVKPVNTAQLEQVIRKAVLMIRNISLEGRNREKLEHLERNNRVKNIEELLDRLTDGDGHAANSLSEVLGLQGEKKVSVCVGEWNKVVPEEGRWQQGERKLVDFAVYNVMTESLKKFPGCHLFRKGRSFCFLILHDDPDLPLQTAKEVRESVMSFLKIGMTIGVGGAVPELNKAVDSYKQALEVLDWAYFNGPGNVFYYQAAPVEMSTERQVEDIQARLIRCIVTASPEEDLLYVLEQLLAVIKHAACGNKHAAVSAVYATILMIRQELMSIGISLDVLEDSLHSLLEKVNGFETLPEVEAYLRELLADINKQVKTKLGNKELIQIKQVKEFIENHYSENITLEKISGQIYMNPSYFSTFFKKHTGENYKQYLTEVRMKNARRLLLQTDLLVYEVAEKVGYSNARLFSEMFRKKFGQIPYEYKQTRGKLPNEFQS